MGHLRDMARSVYRTVRPIPSRTLADRDLTGDREIEWSYGAAQTGRYAKSGDRVMDFGAGSGFLSLAAAGLGCEVLSVDLMPLQFPLAYNHMSFAQADIAELEDVGRFDVIMNCSTIEHVGLVGRYDAADQPDGDIEAMTKMRALLKPAGHMVLTLPVGIDALVRPLHRIYGAERLPRLVAGFRVLEERFVRKVESNAWFEVNREDALTEVGNEKYYAIGLMVLQRDDS